MKEAGLSLSEARLQKRLARTFKYYERVGSTNDEAKAWLAAGAPEGAVVIANEQTRGRGRMGRAWRTPPHAALALSIILKPEAACLPRLNMVAAMSVFDLARDCGCADIGIKWPNDVQVEGMKISGVLPEAIWQGGRLRGAVLGIGVNVRVDFRQSALRDGAISLEDVVKGPLDRAELIAALLRHVDRWYAQIATPALFSRWKARLNTLNTQVSVNGLSGIALDATADGALLIQDEVGIIHRACAGAVSAPEQDERR